MRFFYDGYQIQLLCQFEEQEHFRNLADICDMNICFVEAQYDNQKVNLANVTKLSSPKRCSETFSDGIYETKVSSQNPFHIKSSECIYFSFKVTN